LFFGNFYSTKVTFKNKINANSSCDEIEDFAERLVKACRPNESPENLNIKQKIVVCNTCNTLAFSHESDLKNKESDEFKSQHVNRFRKIIYNEGELDHSDLSLPPTRSNPHPFDPSLNPDLLPPTHSRSLAQYVNHLPVLQNLVKLGVSLFKIEKTSAIGKELVKLNWETDVLPKLAWLISLDVPVTKLGDYLTRNPFFLLQNFDDMKARVNYLRSKRFTKSQIAKIIIAFRYWLNFDVRVIDGRLGWIQKSFKLSGNEVRKLVVLEPRILAFGVAPIQVFCCSLIFCLHCRFVVHAIIEIFILDASQVASSYIYAHFVMGLSNSQIAAYPLIIRCPITYLERRHEFLVRMKRNKYIPGTDDYVPLDAFLHPSDKYFATKVRKVRVSNSSL
uniref:Transcription termination factor 3, mitochondrial n=1 Tax=Syphacia muris TaxID=451379 RepID=A0A0N5AHU1_9BILA